MRLGVMINKTYPDLIGLNQHGLAVAEIGYTFYHNTVTEFLYFT